jgi:spermidine synthase
MTAVEIDPEMIALARTYMELDDLNVTVIEADAFSYLNTTPQPVDVVIDDLYHARGDDVERPLAVNADYVSQLRRHLKPQGSLVMNFVVGPGHDQVFRQACNSFRDAFASIRRIVPPLSHNEILIGTQHPHPPASPRLLQEWTEQFSSAEDREHWKELRTLKLR